MEPSTARRRFLFGRPSQAAARVGSGCLEAQGIVCRACGDACGRRAIGFLPLPGGFARPLVDASRCDACGECVPVCPAAVISLENAQ